METRLRGDGSQLRPDLEPESSGEAVNTSASAAPCGTIEHECSEDISPRYMVEYHGACVRTRWRLDGKARGRRRAEHAQLPRAAGTKDGGTHKSFMNGQSPGA